MQAFEQSLVLAQAAGDLSLELYGHNNLAYHALLAGDLPTARQQIQIGMEMAQTHALFVHRQYLYSTRGEIALAQDRLQEAESFFNQALVEANRHDNRLQAANVRANLALVARARGDIDEALALLAQASKAVKELPAPHLRTKIDLWLAELYDHRGEGAAAAEALQRAER